jgi:hypothetical protein
MFISRLVLHTILVLLFAGRLPVTAQFEEDCGPCGIPCGRLQDEYFSVRLKGGRTDPGRRFTGMVRDSTVIAGESVQAYRLFWRDADGCKDTVVQATHVDALVMGATLGKVPPMYVAVLPVREYQLRRDPTVKASWFEVGPYVGYAGSDESTESPQKIGINTLYFGADVMVSPFGTMLGEKLTLGLGAGLLSEGGRLRVPGVAQLRYTFTSTEVRTAIRYDPGPCQFQCQNDSAIVATVPAGFEPRPGPDSVDPSVVLLRERIAYRDTTAPYLFVEGGWIFDTGFEGSGAEPSVNPEDHAQYLLGGGGGLPILPFLHVQLAYRFMRLNLRTPCENCNDVYQVNTNLVHSVLLRVVYHMDW